MANFPLYDNLNVNLKNKDLLVREKTDFITKINKIDHDGIELIYALIKVHYIKNKEDQDQEYALPYEGKYVEGDMKFDLDNFPTDLKQILYKFIDRHMKKMEEDKQRLNITE